MIDDEKIIEMFFERSEQGIRELDIKYGKICHNLSYNIVNSRQDAEECVNDAYLGAWNAIPPVHPNPLLSYIVKIVRNISLNRRNGAVIRRQLLDSDIVVRYQHCSVEHILTQAYRQNLRELCPHIHGRHCVQYLSVVPIDRLDICAGRVNAIWRYDKRQIGKTGEILDEPSEMGTCAIDVCNRSTELFLILVRVGQVSCDIVLRI